MCSAAQPEWGDQWTPHLLSGSSRGIQEGLGAQGPLQGEELMVLSHSHPPQGVQGGVPGSKAGWPYLRLVGARGTRPVAVLVVGPAFPGAPLRTPRGHAISRLILGGPPSPTVTTLNAPQSRDLCPPHGGRREGNLCAAPSGRPIPPEMAGCWARGPGGSLSRTQLAGGRCGQWAL